MNILLGVCGSISAYKSYDIARGFVKNGHSVKVILTQSATNFVSKLTFEALGVSEVLYPKSDFQDEKFTNMAHIELARWSDFLIVAPLSANTCAKFSRGIADDLITTTFLAISSSTPIILYPAMNTSMLKHPMTQENFERLKKLENIKIIQPEKGLLACGETGEGKLPSIEKIVEITPYLSIKNQKEKEILITTGATISPLDGVRYLTNFSSGLTGYYIAREFLSRGYKVTVISGYKATSKLEDLLMFENFNLERAISTEDMHKCVLKYLNTNTVAYISSAAINDICFKKTNDQKLKKEMIGSSLEIKKTTDILREVLKKKETFTHLKIVGFAAETDLSDEILAKKMSEKPVDFLIGTKVHNGLMPGKSLSGFESSLAQYKIMKSSQIILDEKLDKKRLAEIILKYFETGNI